MEIKDKIIIVTGASQGIGLATARHLSKLGGKIVLAARSEHLLKEIEKEISNSFMVVTDMRKEEDVKKLIDKSLKKYGRIDILINNAGQGMYGLVEKINLADYKKIMDLNVYAILNAMELVIPHMRRQGGGMIVNISSGTSKRYIPWIGAYSSTKYALNALSFIARQELANDGIIVSTVFPKITATNFAKNAIGSRPDFANKIMEIDPAEKVAEKIEEIIRSEKEEIIL